MKLIKLTIDRFKGLDHFEFAPEGKSVLVKGANGSGKTTLMDAYWWLLTGKNSAQSTDFDIYPYSAKKSVESAVEAEFEGADGERFTLRRCIRPKQEKRRAGEEDAAPGNKTDFYINGTPKPQKDFRAFVEEAFGTGETPLGLSVLHWFPVNLKWNDRRRMLIERFAEKLPDDTALIARYKELQPLAEHIGAMVKVEDYALTARDQRKKLKKKMDEIPARIDELEKGKPALDPGVDVSEMPKLAKRRMEINADIQSIQNGAAVSVLKRQIAEMEAEIAERKTAYVRTQSGGQAEKIEALRRKLYDLQQEKYSLAAEVAENERFIALLEKDISELRTEVMQVHNSEFGAGDGACPNCGREYPVEQLEAVKSEFNLRKAEREREITAKGKDLVGMKTDAEARGAEKKKRLHGLAEEIQRLSSEVDELSGRLCDPPDWENTMEGFAARNALQDLKRQLDDVNNASADRVAALQKECNALGEQIAKINAVSECAAQIEKADARIADLKAEEKELAGALTALESLIALTEHFAQIQAKETENEINAAFRRVKWVLFEKQVNGGISPCCRATVDGAAYEHNANTARRYNGGLDIIDGLSRAFGMRLPVWVDNAESVTQLDSIENQVIRLQVSPEDTEIKVEVL